jgi:NTE family protein
MNGGGSPRGEPPIPRIALALGGGSARGLAHILMLEAFDELGLKPAVIAGTSIGAILGAAYASGLSAAEIRAGFEELFRSRSLFLRRLIGRARGNFSTLWSVRRPGVLDNVTFFEMLLPDAMHCDFAALKIPFMAVAADFYAIEQVILDKGPLIPALAASSALPTLARPVQLEGRVLIDGGYVNPLPFDLVMDRADITVAIDVTGEPQRRPNSKLPRTFDALTGATQILFHSITREKLKSARPDILIRPRVGGFGTLDYFRAGDIFAASEPAKQEMKSALLQRLNMPG